MKKTKFSAPVQVFKSGDLAIWRDYDGRYETNDYVVRVMDFNSYHGQYLVTLSDKSWNLLPATVLRPIEV